MTLTKNKYPILEFDSDPVAVLMPETGVLHLPEKCVVTFSDYSARYAAKVSAVSCFEFISCTRIFNIYLTEHNGFPICFCDVPAGASAAVHWSIIFIYAVSAS